MTEKIRVLHLLTGLTSGGVQNVVLNYADAIQPHGVVFDYVVQKDGNSALEKKCIEAGSRIYRLPEMQKKPLSFFLQLIRILRQHPEYRIFHAHQNDLNTFSLLAAKLAAVPVRISHSHSCRPNSSWKKLLKIINHGLLRAISTEQWACSKAAFQWLYDRQFEDRHHEYILHNAINGSKFQHDSQRRRQLREQMGLNGNFVCMCVATLSYNKNQKFLIDVMSYLHHEVKATHIKLVLVGDGTIKSQLEQYASEKGVCEHIVFLGDRSDVHELLNAADCFVLPSMFEGLSVSVIEAQANDLPCILSHGVPQENRIKTDVFFESIGEDAVFCWANRILELRDKTEKQRERTDWILRESGFLLNEEAEKLSARYKELFSK